MSFIELLSVSKGHKGTRAAGVTLGCDTRQTLLEQGRAVDVTGEVAERTRGSVNTTWLNRWNSLLMSIKESQYLSFLKICGLQQHDSGTQLGRIRGSPLW